MKTKLTSGSRHGICLSLLLTAVALFCIIAKTLRPDFILPRITVTALIGLSLSAQVLELWLFPHPERPGYLEAGLLAAAAFAVMSFCSGFAALGGALQVGILGGLVYTLCLLVRSSMEARLEIAAPVRKKAVLTLSAALLLLAAQCLNGIPIPY